MKHFQRIVSCVIATAVALPAMAASTRQAITPAEIAAAINNFGIPIAPQQVELLTNVVATTAHPRLRVESIQRWDNRKMMARLSCADSGQCLPFFVGLHLNQETPANQQTPAPSVAAPSFVAAAQPAATRTPAVRSGMPATLFLDGDHVHIRLTVICMQNGIPGQTIHARDKNHQMVYTAEVADTGILKGRL
jgi:hypothetical protein